MDKNFRCYLKNLIKNTQRSGDYDSVIKELANYGLYGDFWSLCYVMKSPLFSKTKSRHFTRLGRAALKQGKLVSVTQICWSVRRGMDLRNIEFIVRSKNENPI